MTSMDKLWAVFWVAATTVLVTFILSIGYYSNLGDKRLHEAWIACVQAGGQPTNVTVMGSSRLTFTCVRN